MGIVLVIILGTIGYHALPLLIIRYLWLRYKDRKEYADQHEIYRIPERTIYTCPFCGHHSQRVAKVCPTCLADLHRLQEN